MVTVWDIDGFLDVENDCDSIAEYHGFLGVKKVIDCHWFLVLRMAMVTLDFNGFLGVETWFW